MLTLALVLGCTEEPVAVLDDDVRLDAADDADVVESHSTRMCVDDTGSVYVFWVDDRRGSGFADLWMSRSMDLGETWFEIPTKVNVGDGRVSSPAVACADEGVVAVWMDDRDSEIGRTNIYANVMGPEGEFLAEDIAIDDDPLGLSNGHTPVVAVQDEFIAVAWVDDRYGSYDILFNRSVDFGETFAGQQRLGSDQLGEAFSGRPTLALGPNALWVAWEDSRDGSSDIYLMGSETGGSTFQAPRELRIDRGDEPGEYFSLGPQVCADNRGGAAVVWYDQRNGAANDVLFSASSNGLQWFAPAMLESDNPGFANSTAPRCVAQGDLVHAVWTDERSGGSDLHFRTLSDGRAIGDGDVRVDRGEGPGASVARFPQLAISSDGPVVAWLDDRLAIQNGRSQIFNNLYYNYVDDTGQWQEQDFRADAGPNGRAIRSDLNLAVIGRTAFFAWTDDREGTGDIYARVLELGDDIEGPQE
ncbi:MAG: hypothetical protein AAF602_15675 [Myxococcota bacterium]